MARRRSTQSVVRHVATIDSQSDFVGLGRFASGSRYSICRFLISADSVKRESTSQVPISGWT